LIPVRDPIERAVLVAAPRKGSPDARHVAEHLEELTRLVDTAGAEVVGRITQYIAAPNPATLIGEGKVEEVASEIAASDATLVIFDEELSPVQGSNLERELKVRVMDRAEVILDIFSTRARSHEAKLQVELAQLQYLLPRLTRMWTHLSRIRGGIGLRGPGETQLETDRRMIRRKIQGLKEKLKGVEKHRENLRAGRDPMLSVALVGYTNAGKSSILRGLSGQHEIVVEDRLFATLDTLTREVDLGEGQRRIDVVAYPEHAELGGVIPVVQFQVESCRERSHSFPVNRLTEVDQQPVVDIVGRWLSTGQPRPPTTERNGRRSSKRLPS